jgi:hypothetical protein
MPMRELITTYFSAEKTESLFFAAAGLTAIALSSWLMLTGATWRGLAIPLIAVGLIQVGVGASVFLRTDRQVAGLVAQLETGAPALKAAEVPRMEAVMRNFTVFKGIELLVLLAGLTLTMALRRNELAYFAGVGCVAQGALMLVLDLLAEHRGQVYLDALRAL